MRKAGLLVHLEIIKLLKRVSTISKCSVSTWNLSIQTDRVHTRRHFGFGLSQRLTWARFRAQLGSTILAPLHLENRTRFQARSKDQEILEEGCGAGPSR